MTSLEKIFGGQARLKAIRFFLQNPGKVVTSRELAKAVQITPASAVRELSFLRSADLVKKGSRVDIVSVGRKTRKKKIEGSVLSNNFPFFQPLRNLVISASPVSREKMVQYFKSKKNVQLVVLGGIFVETTNQRTVQHEEADSFLGSQPLDLLIVAAKLKKSFIEPFIKKIEVDIGKELAWVLLTPSEFEYRAGMHDKFLRDLFDYQHEFLINRLGVE